MNTTAEKLTYLNETKSKLKDNINLTGAGLTNQTPFRQYATDLKTALLNILNNGIDTLYNNFPKTTGRGTNITLNNTLQAPMRSVINGDTFQQTYTGKNLLENTTQSSRTSNGITFTLNEDGSYTINGTNNGNGNSTVFLSSSASPTKLTAGTYYTILLPTNVHLTGAKIGGGYFQLASSTTNQFTLSEDTEAQIYIQIFNGITTTYNNVKVYPMISKTPITQDDYEPYTGGIASPNPYYPQEIKSVTGLQKVSVGGKNLFDYTQLPIKKISATETIIDNGIKVTDTAIGSSHSVIYKMFDVSNLVGTTFTIKANWVASGSNLGRISIGLCDENGDNRIQGAYNDTSNNSLSYTIPIITTSKYLAIWLYSNTNGTSATNTTYVDYTNIQLEQGSATEYEPYQSQEYEINLGKNILPITNQDFTISNVNFKGQNGKIIVNGTSSQTIYGGSFINSNMFPILLKAGTYTISRQNVGSLSFGLIDNNGNTYGQLAASSTDLYTTFALNTDTQCYLYFYVPANETINNELFEIQIEKGSQVSSFSPYFTPIHLYEDDQIIGTPNNWSIVSDKGELTLDGTYNWNNGSEADTTNGKTFYTSLKSEWNMKILTYQEAINLNDVFIYSNKFQGYAYKSLNTNPKKLNAISIGVNSLLINIANTEGVTDNIEFKQWLQDNTPKLVYELETPTTEPITNTELINQLNAFYNAKSYNGQTNISVQGDLPMILDVSAIIGDE